MDENKFLSNQRKKVGLSQNDIGEQLGYTPQMVSFWESGKGFPNLSTWSKYASLLQIDLEGLIKHKEQKTNNNCDNAKFDSDKFKKNLKKIRISSNLTQIELSKRIKVNNKTVSSWENGLSFPTLEQFVRLCDVFNVSFDDLYFAIPLSSTTKSANKRKKTLLVTMIPIGSLLLSIAAAIAVVSVVKNKNNANVNPNTQLETNNSYHFDDEYHWKENDNGDITEKEKHVFDAVKTKNETCTEDGEITYTCLTCGFQKTEKVEKSGHQNDGVWHFNETQHYHLCATDNVRFDIASHNFDSGTVFEDNGKKKILYHCLICDYQQNSDLSDYVETGEYLYFGNYPQNRVTDELIINDLNSLPETEDGKYYYLNDQYYAKVSASLSALSYESCNVFKDGLKVNEGETYWFNVQPIEWKILEKTDDYYLLLSNIVLDSGPFLKDESNNYCNSSARQWLNSSFYDVAFDDKDSIINTEVDNSLASTKCESNSFVCDNTNDNVYLPSRKDLKSADYGFIEGYLGILNETVAAQYSDYALANGLTVLHNKYSYYYTRTSGEDSSRNCYVVDEFGSIISLYLIDNLSLGYRPMIKISR